MKKRGFTLVELLIVLVFIGALLLIVVPNFSSLRKQTEDNRYKAFLNDVYLATEAYIQKNVEKYPELQENGTAYIYLSDLVNAHYLRSTILNPKTKEKIEKELHYTVVVTKLEDSGYQYELKEQRIEK